MAFEFDPKALQEAAEVSREHFAVPSFDGLSDAVFDHDGNTLVLIGGSQLHRAYLDALLDLHLLVEEYRFSALLALALLVDYTVKRDRGDAPKLKLGDERFSAMPLPAETIAVLRRYAREPPSAAVLFEHPHQQIAGGRILSRWFAGQLIDSTLYRGIAAMDRLAILLRCRAGLPLTTTKRGKTLHPSFLRQELDQLNAAYGGISAWSRLLDLADNPLFEFVKEMRNGFTHERRRPSELHGEGAIVYNAIGSGPEEVVPALNVQDHYALAPAFYNEVLVKGLDATRAVVTAPAFARG